MPRSSRAVIRTAVFRNALYVGSAFLAASLLIGPPASSQTPQVFKVGIMTDAMAPWHSTTEGFRDGLKELGYIEGKNVIFEARAAKGDISQVPRLMAGLVEQKPHLLFCVSDACGQENKGIPMVFVQVSDPVSSGLVQSFSRPGGNITGVANLRAELTAKRLELFKAVVPSLRRVLVTYDPREAEERESVAVAKSAATRLGLTVLERSVTQPLQIEPGLAELKEGGRDGILIVQAGTNLNIAGRSLEVATSNKIPTMYAASFWSKFGAVASYGPDQYAQGRQAARLGHKILTGTPPREIPVELPDRIEFTINLKAAKQLGLKVPKSILVRADRVIE